MYLFNQLFQYFDEYYFNSSLGTYEYLDFKKTVTTLLVLVGGLCLGMMIAAIAAVVQKKHVGKFVRALLDSNASDKASAKSLSDLGFSRNVLIKQELSRASVARKLITVVDGDEVFDYYDDLTASFPAYAEQIKAQKQADLQAEAVPDAEAAQTVQNKDAAAGEETESVTEAFGAKEQSESVGAVLSTEPAPTAKGASRKMSFARSFRPRKLKFDRVRFFIPPELALRAGFRYKAKGNSWIMVVVSFFIFLLLFMIGLRFIPLFVSMLDSSIVNVLGPKI